MAVPKEEEPLNRVTVEPASAVPVIVGVESFVSEILVKEVGASGAVVSIVIEIEEDLEETFPEESVAVNLTEYEPSSRAEEGVIEKSPLLSAVVVAVETIEDPL